jgi:tetratricopeptide (TPR) repeat protein
MSISPNASSATNIGTIWYGRKNYTEALKFYELAISLKPNKPASYRNRGDAYLQLGDTEKARESYERAVQLMEEQVRINPENAERCPAWRSMKRNSAASTTLGCTWPKPPNVTRFGGNSLPYRSGAGARRGSAAVRRADQERGGSRL